MLQTEFNKRFGAWAAHVNGRWLDLDGYPPQQPYQCHDVLLSLITAVFGLPLSSGHAPGQGWTSEVWLQFPHYRPELQDHFTKHHGPGGIRSGDVLFWGVGDPEYPYSHIAVALGPVSGDLVKCVTQNPGHTSIAWLSVSLLLGYLRPRIDAMPAPKPETRIMKTYIRTDKTPAQIKGGGKIYLADAQGKRQSVVSTAAAGKKPETKHYLLTGAVRAEGLKPGDQLVIGYVTAAGGRVGEPRRVAASRAGLIQETVTTQIAVKRGDAVYLEAYAASGNSPGKITRMRSDAWLIETA